MSDLIVPASPQRVESTETDAGWHLQHSYAQLPALFHVAVEATPVCAPELVVFNRPLAGSLGLNADALMGPDGAAIFSGNRLPPGALPIAQAYAGHQYGHFTTLGDGRAILLGEQMTRRGERFDVQLKGAGPTPFSRRGDGRAALGPMLREYVISEAMHALGIPTTRSLAVVRTGDTVWRTGAHPGAVLTRVASSHIRVGTFEWAAAAGGEEALRALVEYTVRRHFPNLIEAANQPLALLQAVVDRQAALIARWMLVGFVHGVMNTDNMAISGETIDYGPCAFLDRYDPGRAFSSIDAHGRYAFGNQPAIAQWNLARFAESLLSMVHPQEEPAIALATEVVGRFSTKYEAHWLSGMRRKLGLTTEESGDRELIAALLTWMQSARVDYTNTFARLTPASPSECIGEPSPEFERWHQSWIARLGRQPTAPAESAQVRRVHNPAFIPRNHLVEATLAAAEQGDIGPLEKLVDVLRAPYDHTRVAPEYQSGGGEGSEMYETFCGT